MSALEFFTPAGSRVRTVAVDGEPWFVIADVAAILGLTNPTMAAQSLYADDLSSTEVIDSMGRTQTARITNEPGLYRLIFQSRKAEAQAFQRWVTHEVLPTIRRTGQFGSALPTNFAEALELAAVKVREIEALEARVIADAPKVAAFEAFMDADGYYSMDDAAKTLGVGRNTLYARLRDLGIIQRGSTTPYQRYMHHFVITVGTWTNREGEIHPTRTTRLKPAGLPFLMRKLKITEPSIN
jgi:anti-repressor protein